MASRKDRPLTERQRATLIALKELRRRGEPPFLRTIAEKMGVKISTVYPRLCVLLDRGLVLHEAERRASYRLSPSGERVLSE